MVPIKSEDQLEGFMVCGPKRSGKVYDHKDVKVLELLPKGSMRLFSLQNYIKKIWKISLHCSMKDTEFRVICMTNWVPDSPK